MKEKIIKDGHIHSPFCPHGTSDSFEQYIDKALEQGLQEMSFTEHMPLPGYFMNDKKFLDECAPSEEQIMKYFEELKVVIEKYKGRIKINIGLEVDFIEGYEEKTSYILDKYGEKLEDSILSVHFIKLNNGEYTDIDGIEGFEKAIENLGSVEKVYDKYYETVLLAIESDLGKYKPKRIGHLDLIRIFNKLYPIEYKKIYILEKIAKELKSQDYEVDVNTAGLRKQYCKEIYMQNIFKELIEKYNIKKVYGSDSHSSSDVGRDFEMNYQVN